MLIPPVMLGCLLLNALCVGATIMLALNAALPTGIRRICWCGSIMGLVTALLILRFCQLYVPQPK